MRTEGLEPSRLAAWDFKSHVSTGSTTSAGGSCSIARSRRACHRPLQIAKLGARHPSQTWRPDGSPRDLKMNALKVSQKEMIGIICGTVAAVLLTGALMMLNVLPALTTPPFVLDSPEKTSGRSGLLEMPPQAQPAKKPGAISSPPRPKAMPNVQLPASPSAATAPAPTGTHDVVASAAPVTPPAGPASTTAGGPPVPHQRPVIAAPSAKPNAKLAEQVTPASATAKNPLTPQSNAKAEIAAALAGPSTKPAPAGLTGATKPSKAQASDAHAGAASTPAKSKPGEGVTASTGMAAAMIKITYAKGSPNAAASAQELIEALNKHGITNIEKNPVKGRLEHNQVKFFHAGDKAVADKLDALASDVKDSHGRHRGYEVIDGTDGSDVPAPGHIEIELRGG